MKRVLCLKKDKEPPHPSSSSIEDATDKIHKRGETVDDKIKKLDVQLNRCKEQIKKTRPGPAQEVVKARAMRALKHKRLYEGQRDVLYNQTCNLEQVADAQKTVHCFDKSSSDDFSAICQQELKRMMRTMNTKYLSFVSSIDAT